MFTSTLGRLLIALSLPPGSMFAAPADHAFIAPGTLKMAARLEEAARAIQPGNSPWQSEVRFRYLETLLPRATNAMGRLMIQRGYAIEALNRIFHKEMREEFTDRPDFIDVSGC
ncbi:MAG: hypothetical protein O2960_23780, partial [Verrucomicrobia bacterium]|nr:hypothetical protein [Verrucomicrobiota bacterium]